jgi:hypothetical protein
MGRLRLLNSRDEAAVFPKLDTLAIHGLPCLVDRLSIIGAFDVFRARKTAITPDVIDAIFTHEFAFLAAIRREPKPELSATDACKGTLSMMTNCTMLYTKGRAQILATGENNRLSGRHSLVLRF